MSENPFGGLGEGGGGFDLGAMLEQAQQMQAQLVAAQEQLAASTVTGSAGGVGVTLTGTGELTGVTIPPGTFDGSDTDSLADLADLVVAAYRDGKSRVDELANQTLGPLAGSLGAGDEPDDRPSGGSSGGFGV